MPAAQLTSFKKCYRSALQTVSPLTSEAWIRSGLAPMKSLLNKSRMVPFHTSLERILPIMALRSVPVLALTTRRLATRNMLMEKLAPGIRYETVQKSAGTHVARRTTSLRWLI